MATLEWGVWHLTKWSMGLFIGIFLLLHVGESQQALEEFAKLGDQIQIVVNQFGENRAVLGYFFFMLFGYLFLGIWFTFKLSSLFILLPSVIEGPGPFTRVFLWGKGVFKKCRMLLG
jgi:hypothetical protein